MRLILGSAAVATVLAGTLLVPAPAHAVRTACPDGYTIVDTEPLLTTSGREVGTLTLGWKTNKGATRFCGEVQIKGVARKRANIVSSHLDLRDRKGNIVVTGDSSPATEVPMLAMATHGFKSGNRVRYVVRMRGDLGASAVAKGRIP